MTLEETYPTYEEYQERVVAYMASLPAMTHGQGATHVLARMKPKMFEEIRNTPLDPFYDESSLEIFYKWVKDNWNRLDEPPRTKVVH